MPKVANYLLVISLSFLLAACASKPTADSDALLSAKDELMSENYSVAAKELLPLAERGNPDAQYALGYLYYYGKGVPQNEGLAKEWIRQAAEQDYVPAQRALQLLTKPS